jgi:uncharacterized protein YjlB
MKLKNTSKKESITMNQHTDLQGLENRFTGIVNTPRVVSELLKDDGTYPNNEKVPLILYQKALNLSKHDPACGFEELFEANYWNAAWRNGIHGFHHYHSTAHEVLGVYSGSAKVQLGGDNGVTLTIKKGDMVVIPAGVAHKNLGSSTDFRVTGGYPIGLEWDMKYGKPGERPQADQNIAAVPMPKADPVYGTKGPLR